MYQEKFSLPWHNYSDHLKSMMKELMMNEHLSDVTLVTEDKKHIKANVNILSTCIPVFKDILRKEKNSSPIMYLRGIQYSEMESIMQFIYLGEATFSRERMDEFLAVAKSLEIQGIWNAESTETVDVTDDVTDDEPDDKPEPSPGYPVTSTKNLEEKIVQFTEGASEERSNVSSANGKHECKHRHKTFSRSGALCTHIKSVHEGVKYACEQCDNQFTQQCKLRAHILSKHKGIQFECDQCDYKASEKRSLNLHFKVKHEGVTYEYDCDQCDYHATHKSNLNKHKQSKHEGIRYACNKCDYKATKQSLLIIHFQKEHEGVRYACDQCYYIATQESSLIRHIKNKHKVVLKNAKSMKMQVPLNKC